MPAQAGIHLSAKRSYEINDRRPPKMDPRLRGDDG
jgi:hypothetical protein